MTRHIRGWFTGLRHTAAVVRFSAVIALLAMECAVAFPFSITPALAATGPFSCASEFFQVLSGQLVEVDPANDTFTDVGPDSSDSYNALGMDDIGGASGSGYLYAISQSDPGELVQVGTSGVPSYLGYPGSPYVSAGYNAGAVDDNGNLWVTTDATPSLYEINLTSPYDTTAYNPTSTPFTTSAELGAFSLSAGLSNEQQFSLSSEVATFTITNTITNGNSITVLDDSNKIPFVIDTGDIITLSNGTTTQQVQATETTAVNATSVTVSAVGGGAATALATYTANSATAQDANINSLPVSALTFAVTSGDTLTLTDGANTETFTATANEAAGKTSIPVTPIAANFYYPAAGTTGEDTTPEITSLSVNGTLGFDVVAGNSIILTDGANTQTFTASAAAASGASTIKVDAAAPNFSYPVGTSGVDTTPKVTQLPVDALPYPIAGANHVILTDGANTNTFTVSNDTAVGATSIAVTASVISFNYPAGTTGTEDFDANDLVDQVQPFTIAPESFTLSSPLATNELTLSSGLSTGDFSLGASLTTSGAITSLTVDALTFAVTSGETLTLTEGADTQTFTASGPAAVGATTILVDSETPNFAYQTDGTIGTEPSPEITSIPVDALTSAVASGTAIWINYGPFSQEFAVTANAGIGATSISVSSQTPNYDYPASGTTVTSSSLLTELSVNPLGFSVAAGDELMLIDGSNTQTFIAAQPAPAGATTIEIDPATPDYAYPVLGTTGLDGEGALSTGSPITSIPVAPLTFTVVAGDSIWLSTGTTSQEFTASAGAAIGATSIPVDSQTPNDAYTSSATDGGDPAHVFYGLVGTILYSINFYGAPGVNPTVTSEQVSGLTAETSEPAYQASYGGGWTDAEGDLFFYNNGTGDIVQITDPTSSPEGYIADTGFSGNGANDAASCDFAPSPFLHPALISPQTYLGSQGIPVTEPSGTLLAGDTGDEVTITSYTQPANGSVTVNPDGSFTYTPTGGFYGTDSFTVQGTDEWGQKTNTATIYVDVRESTTTATVTPSVNPVTATDPVTYTATVSPSVGGTPSGDVEFLDNGTPIAGCNGTGGEPLNESSPDTATCAVTYPNNAGAPHSITAEYLGDNTYAPSTSTSFEEEVLQQTSATLTSNDNPATQGDTVTYTATVAPINGGVGTPTGTVVFSDAGIPIADCNGASGESLNQLSPDVATCTVPYDTMTGSPHAITADYPGDSNFLSSSGSLTETVELPAPPVAENQSYTTTANVSLTIPGGSGLLTGDSGTDITVTSAGPATDGTIATNPDGSFTYTPDSNVSGQDVFDYTIQDIAGQTSTATVTITIEPVAVDQSYTLTGPGALVEGSPGLLANDIGTGLTVTSNSSPGDGTLSVNPDGSFTYTPNPGFSGTDSVSYTVTDADGDTATATATFTVDEPAAPTAVDQNYSTSADQALSVGAPGGLLAGDTGAGITVTSAGPGAEGVIATNPDGSFTYTPDAGISGIDTFPYTVTDEYGQTATGTVTVTIDPVALNDAYTLTAPSAYTVGAPGVLGNDIGTGLTVTSNTEPGEGTLVMNPDGSFTYTPDAGFAGPDSFTYTETDGSGNTATATVSLTVDLPAGPSANDESYTTNADSALDVAAPTGLLDGDTGVDISVISYSSPSDGTVSVNPDGSFIYTPNSGFSGGDSFSYTITDAYGQTASGVAFITVVPVAENQTYTVTGPGPLTEGAPGALAGDLGSGLTLTSCTGLGNGVISVNPNGSFTYTPNPGFYGTDSCTYTVTDSSADTATATLSFTVEEPAPPTASAQNYSTPANQVLDIPAGTGLLDGDTGAGITVTATGVPSDGSILSNADGSFTYTPDANISGIDTFSYTITDQYGQTATNTVTVTIDPVAENDAYTLTGPTALTVGAPGVLGNDVGSGLSVTSNTDPGEGSLSMNPDGSFTYTPDLGFTGPDSFTYTETDSSGSTATATVTLTVDPPAGPGVNDESYTTDADTPLSVLAPSGLLAGDTGVDITVTGNSSPSDGFVSVNPDGSFTYNPDAGFSGADSFTFTVTDAYGQTATGTAFLTVEPVAHNDAYSLTGPSALTVGAPGVLGNDIGSDLTVTANTDPGNGTLVITADGSFIYTPDAGFTGTDSFTYTDTDQADDTATATVILTVNAPAGPTANDESYTATADTPLDEPAPTGLLTGDTGADITVTSNSSPSQGTVAVASDGSFGYIPDAGYSGEDSFTYTVTDEYGQSATATVSITVEPVASNDAYTLTGPTALTVGAPGVLGNDIGSGLSVTGTTDPGEGTLVMNANGSFTYTPDLGYAGTDSFTYTDTDDGGNTATATVTVTIDAPAGPSANDQSYATPADTALDVSAPSGLLNGDTGTDITVTDTGVPSDGSIAANSNGSFTYTPNDGVSGSDTFTYTVTDAYGQTATADVTVTIDPVANNDAYTLTGPDADTVAAPGVLGNDIGSGLSVTSNTDPSHGTLAIDPDGSFTYTPVLGYTGTDSFTYTDTDGNGETATATVTMTIEAPAGPSAVDQAYSTPGGTELDVASGSGLLAGDTGTGITLTATSTPSQGTVSFDANGSFTYTPNAGFSGTDTFTYTVTDAYGQTAEATVTITVVPPAGPTAVDQTYSTNADVALSVDAGSGLLVGDTGTGITVTSATVPLHGSVTAQATGAFDYVPATGYSGEDMFSYTVTDAYGQTAVATVTITVFPVADDDSYAVIAGDTLTVAAPGVLGNDAGTGLAVTAHTAPSHGTLSLDSDGGFTYVPVPGFSGPDTFTYEDRDSAGHDSSEATVTITVSPVAYSKVYTLTGSGPVTITVPAPSGDGPFTYELETGTLPPSTEATVTINPETGVVTIIPAPGFSGVITFKYKVVDRFGDVSAVATLTFNISSPPVPVPSTGANGKWILETILPLLAGILLLFPVRKRRRGQLVS